MQAPETPSTFPALFASVVIARGEHPALVTPDETLSYAELERRTARMARALLASGAGKGSRIALMAPDGVLWLTRSEEHTSELQSLMRTSYAVFCLKKKKENKTDKIII